MKIPDKHFLNKWWQEARKNYSHEELLRYFTENREKLESYVSEIDGKKTFYRLMERFFKFLSRIAGAADRVSERMQEKFARTRVLNKSVTKFREFKNHLNFKELIEFMRVKIFSLRKSPHNEKAILLLEEIIEKAGKHGLDINKYFPDIYKKVKEKKYQLLQHKFFREFSKSRLEQLLAIPFNFERCIFPVLPDSSFWHRIFEKLERKKVADIILFDKKGNKISFNSSTKVELRKSETIKTLRDILRLKEMGRRIFFVGHHEGYLGPYFVRSVIRKLGFEKLTGNCNTIVGPRMFSNVVLRNGAANVGNLLITVPSQKTTRIKTSGLADALRKTAKKTQALIKLDQNDLNVLENLEYEEFVRLFANETGGEDFLDKQIAEVDEKNESNLHKIKEITKADYELFKKIMRECFLLFPEGSRSFIDTDGAVKIKYVNPKYIEAYMKPGDYIVPVNLVGGSDLTRGWKLHKATLGLCIDEPMEVTEETIENYEFYGLDVMRKIADLPNLKEVRFNQ
ncbi:MAG: hypothetical protein GXP53_01350 [Deltaproteobacteria bacterium]|nr:hypothetical protein [Deltaproteobacteria bacterium]